MISHKYKSAYIHIPKTGGSAIENVLRGNSFEKLPDRISAHRNYVKNPAEWTIKHTRVHELPEKYHNFFIFTFVRNPWDLMVSSFFWWTQKTTLMTRANHGKELEKNGFRSFILSRHSSAINECCHNDNGQLYWLNDNVKFIGRFENFQEDFNIACDGIGMPRQRLPHINKSNHKHYTEYYDDETHGIIARKYAKDIEYFGYEFGE